MDALEAVVAAVLGRAEEEVCVLDELEGLLDLVLFEEDVEGLIELDLFEVVERLVDVDENPPQSKLLEFLDPPGVGFAARRDDDYVRLRALGSAVGPERVRALLVRDDPLVEGDVALVQRSIQPLVQVCLHQFPR